MVSKHWHVHTKFNAYTPDGAPDSYKAIPAETELDDVERVTGAAPDAESISLRLVQFHYNGERCRCRIEWLQEHATPMDSTDALLAMGEYKGTEEAFLRESVTSIQRAWGCSAEESERILRDMRDRGEIDLRITPGGELREGNIPFARWYWSVSRRAG